MSRLVHLKFDSVQYTLAQCVDFLMAQMMPPLMGLEHDFSPAQ
ncbi:MAG: hypothetical protein WAO71_04925 [Gallionella sp.]